MTRLELLNLYLQNANENDKEFIRVAIEELKKGKKIDLPTHIRYSLLLKSPVLLDETTDFSIYKSRLNELLLNEKYDELTDYIYTYYPQNKQNSDLSDKIYYENLLKAQGITDIERDIVDRVEAFYSGKSLEEVVKDVKKELKEAYLQLVKVGIRVAWVQNCKSELKKAIEEKREPKYPEYPL